MTNKDHYIAYCKNNKVSFFNRPWWLEIVSSGNWDCVILKKKELTLGYLPYVNIKRYVFNGIGLPLLTQYINPILVYPKNQKYSKKLGFEKDVLKGLYTQLPKVHFVQNTWGHELTNWLPLYWMGFKQTTRYSYCIDNIKDHDQVFANFETKIRGDIRKASKSVKILTTKDPKILYNLVFKTFERKSLSMPYTFDLFEQVVNSCLKNECGEITYAIDQNNNIHAAVFIVWDTDSAFYLLGGGDTAYRNSGATSLLLWEGIKKVSAQVDRFDFEGSMMEPIERFVRGFGSKQVSLNMLSKSNSMRYSLIHMLRELRSLKK